MKWRVMRCAEEGLVGDSFMALVGVQLWRIASRYQGVHYGKWIEHILLGASLAKNEDPIYEPIVHGGSLWKPMS